MSEQLKREFIGIDFNFSQYIQDNIEEAVSGVKGENSVKIFGRDLAELERLSKSLKTEIATVPGRHQSRRLQPARPAQSRHPDRSRQGGALRLLGRRHQLGRAGGDRRPGGHAGLRRRDEFRAHRAPRAANTGATSTPSARSRLRCPNNDPKAPTAYIALGELGDVKLETGAAYIYRENSQRFVPLKYSVRGRDLGSTVAEAQKRHRREGAAAAGLPHRMGRRVRRAGGSQEAARRHRAAEPAPDHDAALQPVQFRARQPARAVRHSVRGGRRHSRALRRRAELQRLGGDRLHLAVRRLGDGRHPAGLLHPQEHGRRAWRATRRSSSPAKPACGRSS